MMIYTYTGYEWFQLTMYIYEYIEIIGNLNHRIEPHIIMTTNIIISWVGAKEEGEKEIKKNNASFTGVGKIIISS